MTFTPDNTVMHNKHKVEKSFSCGDGRVAVKNEKWQ